MNTSKKLTKVAQGHYKGQHGDVINVYSTSGAPHTRNSRARWLVRFNDGRSTMVSRLSVARDLIA